MSDLHLGERELVVRGVVSACRRDADCRTRIELASRLGVEWYKAVPFV